MIIRFGELEVGDVFQHPYDSYIGIVHDFPGSGITTFYDLAKQNYRHMVFNPKQSCHVLRRGHRDLELTRRNMQV
jgi:hypothetical protein